MIFLRSFRRPYWQWLLPVWLILLAIAVAPRAQAAAGDLDPLNLIFSFNLYESAAVTQPDGKIVVVGAFSQVFGVTRKYIARFNVDGTLDTGFDPNPNAVVHCVVVQADGKILLGGDFTALQPNGAAVATTRNYIARVNADGTLDPGFDPKADSSVNSIAVQPDGKVLLGGGFTKLQPNGAVTTTTRNRIARVNADGTLDPGFDPSANGSIYCIVPLADGRVLLGGGFLTLQPNGAAVATSRKCIARVNADGTLDPGFDPQANDFVRTIAVQADGKMVVGGDFGSFGPNSSTLATVRRRIARLNADGTVDPGFNPTVTYVVGIPPAPNPSVFCVAVQTDGKVLVGGNFNTLQPNGAAVATTRNRLARLNADGTLDAGFNPNANSTVFGLTVQTDGRVLTAGAFTILQPNGAATGTTRTYVARLLNDPATQTLTVPDATQVLWSRSGAGPELSQVTFEQSLDGGANWTALGNGTRVGTTANWQLTGLSLPASGSLRARGRNGTSGGFFGSGSGMSEQVASFTLPTVTAANDTLSRLNTSRVAKVPATTLLANDTATTGTLSLTSVQSALPAGATVAVVGNFVVYTAPATNSGAGSFTYTVGNGTDSATATVTVSEITPPTPDFGPNNAAITTANGGADFVTQFIGVPGYAYRVQYTTNLTPPYTWNDFTPTPADYTAPDSGVFQHIDVAPGGNRFYRAIPKP
jgi:uncharacterized delta-60 repeat protein